MNQIDIMEYSQRITSYALQYYNSTTSQWVNIATGTQFSVGMKCFEFSAITARLFRIYIYTASAVPQIAEFLVNNIIDKDYIYYKVDGQSMSLGVMGYYERK